jgi:alginate lyase
VNTKLTAAACALAATGALLAGQAAMAAPALNTGVAPGGNFTLSVWELQEPTGSPGSPTTISPSRLKGASGYQDKYFYTDSSDGSMTFWDPENGVHTPNSNYSRSELREMNSNGSAASWGLPGTHKLSATVKITKVPSSVCVGQIHASEGSGTTKPLIELYYHSNGDIVAGIENGPGGGQTPHTVGHVSLNTKWSYVISVTGGNTINIQINGGSTQKFAIPSGWNGYPQYFKAGDYNQTASSDGSKGATVHFYALTVSHS